MRSYNTVLPGSEMPVSVYYEFDPGQREILYPNDIAQPYYAPTATATAIIADFGADYDLLADLSSKVIEAIEDEIADAHIGGKL